MKSGFANKYVYQALVDLPFVNADGSEDQSKKFSKGETFVIVYDGDGDPLFGHVYYGRCQSLDISLFKFEELCRLWWYDLGRNLYMGGDNTDRRVT